MLEVYIDGACEPVNPGGTASYGVVVLKEDPHMEEEHTPKIKHVLLHTNSRFYHVVWEEGRVVGSGSKMSNNVAEYSGLIAFFRWYGSCSDEPAKILSDSQLLVNQMNLQWKARKGLYIPYFETAIGLMAVLTGQHWPKPEFKWIPREDNTLADELAVKALKEVGIYRRK